MSTLPDIPLGRTRMAQPQDKTGSTIKNEERPKRLARTSFLAGCPWLTASVEFTETRRGMRPKFPLLWISCLATLGKTTSPTCEVGSYLQKFCRRTKIKNVTGPLPTCPPKCIKTCGQRGNGPRTMLRPMTYARLTGTITLGRGRALRIWQVTVPVGV